MTTWNDENLMYHHNAPLIGIVRYCLCWRWQRFNEVMKVHHFRQWRQKMKTSVIDAAMIEVNMDKKRKRTCIDTTNEDDKDKQQTVIKTATCCCWLATMQWWCLESWCDLLNGVFEQVGGHHVKAYLLLCALWWFQQAPAGYKYFVIEVLVLAINTIMRNRKAMSSMNDIDDKQEGTSKGDKEGRSRTARTISNTAK